jgi:hypothetical protein
MPSPFPGMDPYIETPALWSDFHNNLRIKFTTPVERVPPPPDPVDVVGGGVTGGDGGVTAATPSSPPTSGITPLAVRSSSDP